jgi:hypothetical protein
MTFRIKQLNLFLLSHIQDCLSHDTYFHSSTCRMEILLEGTNTLLAGKNE